MLVTVRRDLDKTLYCTNSVIKNPLYHHQSPRHDQRFNGVGEGVGLVGPCHIRRGHQNNSKSPVFGRRDKLMKSPVFQHEAQQEHQDPQGVVYDLWRDLLFPSLRPYPL